MSISSLVFAIIEGDNKRDISSTVFVAATSRVVSSHSLDLDSWRIGSLWSIMQSFNAISVLLSSLNVSSFCSVFILFLFRVLLPFSPNKCSQIFLELFCLVIGCIVISSNHPTHLLCKYLDFRLSNQPKIYTLCIVLLFSCCFSFFFVILLLFICNCPENFSNSLIHQTRN